MEKLSDRMIRSMPYEKREQRYREEKERLFYEIQNLTPEQVHEKHMELVKKWHI